MEVEEQYEEFEEGDYILVNSEYRCTVVEVDDFEATSVICESDGGREIGKAAMRLRSSWTPKSSEKARRTNSYGAASKDSFRSFQELALTEKDAQDTTESNGERIGVDELDHDVIVEPLSRSQKGKLAKHLEAELQMDQECKRNNIDADFAELVREKLVAPTPEEWFKVDRGEIDDEFVRHNLAAYEYEGLAIAFLLVSGEEERVERIREGLL